MGTPRRVHRRRHSKELQTAPSTPSADDTHFPTRPSQDAAIIKNQSMFSPEQQKVIIEHLLITKNSAPQKNYGHVPCKFYRQGACQAGPSCPFSHSLDAFAADQQPCEYFKRGNCKFGLKCVNAHITSDGVDVKKALKPSTPPLQSTDFPSAAQLPSQQPQQLDLEDVFEDEEYFLPNDFSDLLTPEELSHRRSRSSSSSTSLKPDPASAASSYSSEPLFHHHHQRSLSGNSTTSPLLHQQLAFFHATQSAQAPLNSPYNYTYATRPLQFKTQPAWAPAPSPATAVPSNPFVSHNDLTKSRIDEEESSFLLDGVSSGTSYNI